MRKLIMLVFVVGVLACLSPYAYAQPDHRHEAFGDAEGTVFFGQVVGGFSQHHTPHYVIEAGLDHRLYPGTGIFTFMSINEHDATVIGGGTKNILFHWLRVGAGLGYGQESNSVVAAGMLLITQNDAELRAYGWAGEDAFYTYWVEGILKTDYGISFGATWQRHLGLGTWGGYAPHGTPAEFRVGIKMRDAFYRQETEGADLTYEGTVRINLTNK